MKYQKLDHETLNRLHNSTLDSFNREKSPAIKEWTRRDLVEIKKELARRKAQSVRSMLLQNRRP